MSLLTAHPLYPYLADWQEDVKRLELTCSEGQTAKIIALYDALMTYNAHTNLTRLTSPQDYLYRHVLDSLSIVRHVPKNASLADVGSGGGFPALPLAIIRPDVRITAIESIAKKAAFIQEATKTLGMKNLYVCPERSEVLGQQSNFREQFDCVTARALAPLPVLLELTLPLLKPPDQTTSDDASLYQLLAIKGPSAAEEIQAAQNALKVLNAKIHTVETLPIEQLATTHIVIIDKLGPTPKQYPRSPGTPKKSPL